MKKFVKFFTMIMTLVMICATVAPAAFADTPEWPVSWSGFPLQSENQYQVNLTTGLQRYLNISINDSLNYTIACDGKYGWRTADAVSQYQKKVGGLIVDGICGSSTWGNMYNHISYKASQNDMRFYRVKAVFGTSPSIDNPYYDYRWSRTNWWWYANMSNTGNNYVLMGELI